jgi:hypothetical protein
MMVNAVRRFAESFIAILAFILAMVLLHWVTFRAIGRRPEHSAIGRRLHVVDCSFSADGQRAISRSLLDPWETRDTPLASLINLHDAAEAFAPQRVDIGPLFANHSVISPCGRQVAVATRDARVVIFPLEPGPSPTVPIDSVWPDWLSRIHWSADGDRIVGMGHATLYVWSAKSGQLLYRIDDADHPFESIVLRDDQTFWSYNGERLQLHSADDGSTIRSIKGLPALRSFAVARDGGQIVAVHDDGIAAIDAQDGGHLWGKFAQRRFQHPIAISADARLVAIATRETNARAESAHRVHVYECDSGKPVAALDPQVGGVAGLAFGTDKHLYAWGDAGALSSLDSEGWGLVWRHSLLEKREANPVSFPARLLTDRQVKADDANHLFAAGRK